MLLYVANVYQLSKIDEIFTESIVMTKIKTGLMVAMSLLLGACGNQSSTSYPGSGTANTLLSGSITSTGNFTASDLQGSSWLAAYPSDQQALISTPVCGVKMLRMEYATVGGVGEQTTASGVVMLPTGTAAACQGGRPILLYTHGTAVTRSFDLSVTNDSTNAAYSTMQHLALIYAAQGYIVIAPNYAGYNTSTLPYHPYLNPIQQSQDSVDALTAGRQVIAQQGSGAPTDNGKLFVAGYSQGGYVAMATLQHLQQIGAHVSAGGPMSGPYALEAFGDQIFSGHIGVGTTVFSSMMLSSFEHLPSGSLSGASILNPSFSDADQLFPGQYTYSNLPPSSMLPATALFQSSPTGYANLDAMAPGPFIYGLGFDATNYLIQTNYRENYVNDMSAYPDGAVPTLTSNPVVASTSNNGLRAVLRRFDLRAYQPSMPIQICGGNGDPTVYFAQNSVVMNAMLNNAAASNSTLQFALLDLDTRGTPGNFTSHGFTASQQATMSAAATAAETAFTTYQSAQQAANLVTAIENYHDNEHVYCSVAERSFFNMY